MGGDDVALEQESQAEKAAKFKYKVLSEPQVVNGKIWPMEWLLSKYVECTDGLIGKMDGTILVKNAGIYVLTDAGLKLEKRDLSPPASVIYLDKSARPVEWFVRSLWPVLARIPGSVYTQGEVPPKPKEFFLNIDKGDWLRRMGVPEKHIEDVPPEMVDLSKIDKEHLTRIRALFSTKRIDEGSLDEAWNHPTIFDGQHVMIVDEVLSSGMTLKIAQMLLSSAIPEAIFSGQHWAKPKRIPLNKGAPIKNEGLQFKVEWVPIWYNPNTASGRGIGDRDFDWPEAAEERGLYTDRYSRVGRYVLSTPSHDPLTYEPFVDKKGVNLRNDILQLAIDLKEHRVFYRPSLERSNPDDMVDRIVDINKMRFEDWKDKLRALEPKSN